MTMSEGIIRTEEWQFDYHGMLSTLLLEVHAGERVRVSEEMADELCLEGGTEDVDSGRQVFFLWYPYEQVAKVLADKGGETVLNG